jgi:hypothetical protein
MSNIIPFCVINGANEPDTAPERLALADAFDVAGLSNLCSMIDLVGGAADLRVWDENDLVLLEYLAAGEVIR